MHPAFSKQSSASDCTSRGLRTPAGSVCVSEGALDRLIGFKEDNKEHHQKWAFLFINASPRERKRQKSLALLKLVLPTSLPPKKWRLIPVREITAQSESVGNEIQVLPQKRSQCKKQRPQMGTWGLTGHLLLTSLAPRRLPCLMKQVSLQSSKQDNTEQRAMVLRWCNSESLERTPRPPAPAAGKQTPSPMTRRSVMETLRVSKAISTLETQGRS